MNALIVEPHPATGRMMKNILDSLGFNAELCEDTECARDYLSRENPLVIVVDQVLPAQDGFEFCREIRSMQIPAAIVVIASCSPDDCVDAMLTDVDDVVFRPFDTTRLRVRFALALHRGRQKVRERQATVTSQAFVKALETMHLGVTITDMQGRILFINEADASMHGYEVEELIGKNARIFSPSKSWNWLTPEQMTQFKSWNRESINVRKDGTVFNVQLLSDVIKGSTGEVVGMVTTCEDITDLATHPESDELRQLSSL